MRDNQNLVNILDVNLFDEAHHYVRQSIDVVAYLKEIVLSPQEVDTWSHAITDEFSDATIYCLAFADPAQRERASSIVLARLRDIYVHKLCELFGEQSQRPFFTEIAIRHHVGLAEQSAPYTWPPCDLHSLSKHISSDTGPLSWVFADGVLTTTYYRGVLLHRDESEGPAFQAVDLQGNVIEQEYWLHGQLHRNEGPARIVCDATTDSIHESWMQSGRFHRSGGPAFVERARDGRVLTELWYSDGVFCRTDGPAGIWRGHDPHDASISEHYSLDGLNVRTFQNGIEVPYAG